MVEKDFQKGEPFEGYRGHNQFEIENGVLVNVFPKYNKEDNNSNPTDGESKVTYQLIAGEAGWILKPLKISMHE